MVKYKLEYVPKKGKPFYGKKRFIHLTSAHDAEKRAMKSGKYKHIYIA